MWRQSPRRNGRNKGLRVKHVLQISVLLGVVIWLLYQLQQPFDKKSAVEISKFPENVPETINLGRKDLKNGVEDVEEEKGVEDHSDEELSEDDNKLEDHDIQEVAVAFDETGENLDEENSDDGAENINEGEETEDVKLETEGTESDNSGEKAKEEITEGTDANTKGNEGGGEFTDQKIEQTVGKNTTEETAVESNNQEVKSDEVKLETVEDKPDKESGEVKDKESDASRQNHEQKGADLEKNAGQETEGMNRNSTADSNSSERQLEIKPDETKEVIKEITSPGEGEKEKLDHESSVGTEHDDHNKAESNSTSDSILTENVPTNETSLDHSDKSNSTYENSALDPSVKADPVSQNDTLPASNEDQSVEVHREPNSEALPEKSGDEKTGASTGNDVSANSLLQEEKDARTDITTLPGSGTGDISHEEAIAK